MLNILKTFFIGLINVTAVVLGVVVVVAAVNYFPICFFVVLGIVIIWFIGRFIQETKGRLL